MYSSSTGMYSLAKSKIGSGQCWNENVKELTKQLINNVHLLSKLTFFEFLSLGKTTYQHYIHHHH